MVSTTTTVAPGQLLQYKPVTDANGKQERVGQSSYGALYEYVDTQTDEAVAIKRIELSKLEGDTAQVLQRYLLSELLDQQKMHHPHVLKLKDVFMTSDHLNIVQELVQGGTLLDCVNYCLRRGRPMGEDSARWIFQQLVMTIEYLHLRGLSGRSFDHTNILLAARRGVGRPLIKVADFGLSKYLDALPVGREPCMRMRCPEMFAAEQTGHSSCSGETADIWRAGILLHEILTGVWPWKDDVHRNISERNICCQRPLPRLPAHLSAECRDLLESLLHPDPEARITVEGIKQHPWFLQDLPPGASELAEQCLERSLHKPPPCLRSPEQLQAILREAVQRMAEVSSSEH